VLSSLGHPANLSTQDVPVQVEDRLAAAGADVDEHAVVLEPGAAGRLGDEVEDALRLLGRELGDVAERVDVSLRNDEQMRLGLRVDVADRDQALGRRDVLALARELAEEAVGLRVARQRAPPRS
jgi:hypothetical protein